MLEYVGNHTARMDPEENGHRHSNKITCLQHFVKEIKVFSLLLWRQSSHVVRGFELLGMIESHRDH